MLHWHLIHLKELMWMLFSYNFYSVPDYAFLLVLYSGSIPHLPLTLCQGHNERNGTSISLFILLELCQPLSN